MPDNFLGVMCIVLWYPLGVDGKGAGFEEVGRVGEFELAFAVKVSAIIKVIRFAFKVGRD